MDREEAVCSNENSRFGNRAEAALVRIFALSLENLFSRAHLLPLCACSSLLVCQSIVLKWHHKPFRDLNCKNSISLNIDVFLVAVVTVVFAVVLSN